MYGHPFAVCPVDGKSLRLLRPYRQLQDTARHSTLRRWACVSGLEFGCVRQIENRTVRRTKLEQRTVSRSRFKLEHAPGAGSRCSPPAGADAGRRDVVPQRYQMAFHLPCVRTSLVASPASRSHKQREQYRQNVSSQSEHSLSSSGCFSCPHSTQKLRSWSELKIRSSCAEFIMRQVSQHSAAEPMEQSYFFR